MKMNEREDARKEVNMSIVAYMTYMSDKLTYMLKANLPFYVYYAVFFVMIFFYLSCWLLKYKYKESDHAYLK